MIEAAKAEFEGTDLYKAIQGQREVVEGLSYLEQADTWVNSWKELRVVDKYSGAAGLLASGLAPSNPSVPNNCNEDNSFVIPDDEEVPAMNAVKTAGGFQSRPPGSKAAKEVRTTEAALLRQALATTAVLEKTLGVSKEKMDQAFWTSADMRHPPEAATWRRLEAQDRLKAYLERQAAQGGAAAAASPVPASPAIDLPDLPVTPTRPPANDMQALPVSGARPTPEDVDSTDHVADLPHPPVDGAVFVDGSPSPPGSLSQHCRAAPAARPYAAPEIQTVHCVETDEESNGIEPAETAGAVLVEPPAGVTNDRVAPLLSASLPDADEPADGPAVSIDKGATADIPAVFVEEGGGGDEPAASIDEDTGAELAAAEVLYQEAAAQALGKLSRAADAVPVGAASEEDLPVAVARVGSAGAAYVSWEVGDDEGSGDAVVNGNASRPRGRKRPLRQVTRQEAPRGRKRSRGRKAQSTKQSAFEEGLRRAAIVAGMDPTKLDLSSDEETEDDGRSAGSMTV
ncbi:hypothetical protein I4F81_008551 [Pyropia yezoensis]|uniref:Uncharacterized protein n=1 Tax=Pyropia yezoensis TaxID=2788 RepID=A0ACC3C8F9_PYRYE|nr:hypothetical protein I4F81_008551 [Neopyropia yezoensis]